MRKLEDLYANLNDLAANRDVAGFVNARKAGLTDIGRGDEDFGVAARRRHEDYDAQAREEETNRQRSIAAIQAAAQVEAQQRAMQLAERLQQEQAAGQQQITQSQTLQNQLAALRDSWAKQDLAARRKVEDSAYNTQISALQQRQQAITGIVSQTTQPVVTFFGNVGQAIVNMINTVKSVASSASGTSGGSTLKAYAGGSPYITETGPIIAHKGEKIMTSSEARNSYVPRTSGRGGVNVTVNVAGVGALVSQTQLDNTVESIVSGVERAVGRG